MFVRTRVLECRKGNEPWHMLACFHFSADSPRNEQLADSALNCTRARYHLHDYQFRIREDGALSLSPLWSLLATSPARIPDG
jgi:hypothetical protein